MDQEYRKLSQTLEEVKEENVDLKNSSMEPRSVQLGKTDSLQIELSKLKTENESLRIRSSDLESEIEKLKRIMSSWTQSSVSPYKLCAIRRQQMIELCALNEMDQEYRKLSQTLEEVKEENVDLKNSSMEPRSVQLGKTDSLQIELSKLKTENESLRIRSSDLESEIENLNLIMSS
ncbi:hypothetical protein F511_05685 [Dorcoceras hygrometricum]|uniref:Uncharacterized protein n=1 Tax=Dorcoceras hygrometricum TaxID=472368 RepID=A0A2Z7D449_9LAMI|nr:hypothetical protein F511_05685 [Dorcoceras hygrometricum]